MAASSQFSIAVHALTILAASSESRVKSDYIAKKVNTNPVVIRRLLSNLQESGLVSSQVGATGGSLLAKRPRDIRLSEVYKSVSCGEVFALSPNAPDKNCPVGRNIAAVLCDLQREVDKTVEEKLNQYTLRDVIERIEEA